MTTALRDRLAELALATGGTVGIAATQLASGRHLGVREHELFPLASLVKVPILVALYEAIRGGEIDPRERVRYAEATRVPGSGILQDLDDGLELTVRDVATLMIAISDNTAADLLLARVGKPRVEAVMDRAGVSSIRVPFSIRELFEELVDLPGGSYEELRQRLRVSAGSGGRAVLAEETDRGTPHDICKLFELLEGRAILDDASCAAVLDILRRTKADSRIPALLPQGILVAHKTGTIRGVRCDAGVVYAPKGPYAVAILSKGVGNDVRADVTLAEISLVIYEEFAG